jgi:hypothetical protein
MAAATWSGEGAGSSLSSSNMGPTTSTPRDVRQSEEYELSQNQKICYSILVSSLDSYPAFQWGILMDMTYVSCIWIGFSRI